MTYEEKVFDFLKGKGEPVEFLDDMTDIEKLEAVVFERSAELLLYRAFVKEKGLEKEFRIRLEQAKAIAKAEQ